MLVLVVPGQSRMNSYEFLTFHARCAIEKCQLEFLCTGHSFLHDVHDLNISVPQIFCEHLCHRVLRVVPGTLTSSLLAATLTTGIAHHHSFVSTRLWSLLFCLGISLAIAATCDRYYAALW